MTLSSSFHLEVTASYLPKLHLQRSRPWHVRSLTAYSLFSCSKRLACSEGNCIQIQVEHFMTLHGSRSTHILKTKEFQQVPIPENSIFELLLVAPGRQRPDTREFVHIKQAGKELPWLNTWDTHILLHTKPLC